MMKRYKQYNSDMQIFFEYFFFFTFSFDLYVYYLLTSVALPIGE